MAKKTIYKDKEVYVRKVFKDFKIALVSFKPRSGAKFAIKYEE